jgi:hypothetical protein
VFRPQTNIWLDGTYSIHKTHSSQPFILLRGVTYITLKICRTIVLPVVSYGCETWSLTFREERRRRPRKFENRVLTRISGHKRHKVTEERRRLCNSLEQRSSREAKRSQLVKKFSQFKGNRRFITARTAIFRAITQVGLFPSGFPTKILYALLLSPMTTTCPAHLIQFNLFSIHLTHRGHDPLDMELVNTEIRLQISYMKQTQYNYFKVHPNRRHLIIRRPKKSYISYRA